MYALTLLLLLGTLVCSEAPTMPQCNCKERVRGNWAEHTAYTYMPAACYQISQATLCTYHSKKYWTGQISTHSNNCGKYGHKGKRVCWTYLTHWGMSDGGGVQDQALEAQIQKTVQKTIDTLKGLHEGTGHRDPSPRQLE